MGTPHNKQWDIGKYPPFKESFRKLSPKQQWIVQKHLDNMTRESSIEDFVKSSNCPHLDVPGHENYHAIDVARSGEGNYTVKLTVMVDPADRRIWPIYCKDYSDIESAQ